jgi:hypothetical protein
MKMSTTHAREHRHSGAFQKLSFGVRPARIYKESEYRERRPARGGYQLKLFGELLVLLVPKVLLVLVIPILLLVLVVSIVLQMLNTSL